jgi:hypothetical protein
MERVRKSLNVAEEEDMWTLMPLGGDVDEGAEGGDDVSPTAEAMTFVDLQKLCKERNVFPEFLFFESHGSTQRDIRLQEKQHRVSTSTMVPPPLPMLSSPSVCGASYVSGNNNDRHDDCDADAGSQQQAGHYNYGTLSKAKDEDEERREVTFSNVELHGHWCEGSGCTIS